jgi:predicted phosphoribosyltransferase
VSFDGDTVLNLPLIGSLGLSEREIRECVTRASKAVRERLDRFRGDRPLPDLRRKVVILVDDGLASGYTMLAAVRSVKKDRPQKVVVAAPTGSLSAVELLSPETDEIVCLNIRGGPFFAVADAYRNWYDVTDEEVLEILKGLESTKL